MVCPVEGQVAVERATGTVARPAGEVAASSIRGSDPGFTVFGVLTPGVAKVTEGGMCSTTAILSAPVGDTPAVITPSHRIPKGVTTVD